MRTCRILDESIWRARLIPVIHRQRRPLGLAFVHLLVALGLSVVLTVD